METFFKISETVKSASDTALKTSETAFSEIDRITEYNQQKVLAAFIKNRVDETDFYPTTGYGYNDKGREKLDRLLADVFGTEDALICAANMTWRHAHACNGAVRRSATGRYHALRVRHAL